MTGQKWKADKIKSKHLNLERDSDPLPQRAVTLRSSAYFTTLPWSVASIGVFTCNNFITFLIILLRKAGFKKHVW
jgi:hypothetical protein